MIFEIGVTPKLRCWAQMSSKQTRKNLIARNSVSALMNPLEMVKKKIGLWNRSILMSEIGVRPKLRYWAHMSSKQTQKI